MKQNILFFTLLIFMCSTQLHCYDAAYKPPIKLQLKIKNRQTETLTRLGFFNHTHLVLRKDKKTIGVAIFNTNQDKTIGCLKIAWMSSLLPKFAQIKVNEILIEHGTQQLSLLGLDKKNILIE